MSPQAFIRVSAILAAAGFILQPAFSQGRGGTAGGGATAGPSTGPTTGGGAGIGTTTAPGTSRPPTTTNPTSTTPTPTQPSQPIFISGRVLMEDGNPPTESVPIERVCSGAPHTEGYTDSRGYFSIQLGAQNNGVLHDASEDMSSPGFGSPMGGGNFGSLGGGSSSNMRSGFGDNRFADCELRARMAGFRSQSVSLASRRAMDPPDIGTILMHRLGANEGTTVSASSLAAPKDARKAFEKGMEALKKRKTDDAVKNFEKAVEAYPTYAMAWNELGRIQAARGDPTMAFGSFQTAAKADPKFVSPYLEMALIEWKGEKWQQVADLTDKVIKLDSFDYPQAHFLNALANYYLKNMDAAEKSAREAVRLDTRKQYATTLRLLGVILAQKQDYSGAAAQLKAYLQVAPQATDAQTVKNQLSQLEQLQAAGKQ